MGVGPSLAPFSHHAWLGYWEHVPVGEPLVVIHRRQVTHCLMYLPTGRIFVRSLHRGHESRHTLAGGAVSFSPADGQRRSLVGEHNPAHDFFTLLIPRQAVGLLAASEGVAWTIDDLNCFVTTDDAVLQWCMERLAAPPSKIRELQLRNDEAARRLLFRLQELSGGGVPDWHTDGSVFHRAEMQQFVDYIDAHLRLAPTLSTMAVVANGTETGVFMATCLFSCYKVEPSRPAAEDRTRKPPAVLSRNIAFSPDDHEADESGSGHER